MTVTTESAHCPLVERLRNCSSRYYSYSYFIQIWEVYIGQTPNARFLFTYWARSGCRSPQLPFYLTCTLLAFQDLSKSCAATPLSVVLNLNFIVYAMIELCYCILHYQSEVLDL